MPFAEACCRPLVLSLIHIFTFLKNSHEPYVVIAAGDGVYKLDYNKVLEYHIEKKADITVVCKDMEHGTDVTRFGCVTVSYTHLDVYKSQYLN